MLSFEDHFQRPVAGTLTVLLKLFQIIHTITSKAYG